MRSADDNLVPSDKDLEHLLRKAQKLVDAWDADPDNYSQLEEGLTALKAALEKCGKL